jgi:tetratricopeptide (TPR) repeat protein
LEFAGFISYSGSAGPTAARLHRALERYAIPRALRGRKSKFGLIGKTAGKFFVDRAELSATPHLKADIEAALEKSNFLIVLCSPEAAQSTWVPLEINFFRRLGRGDRILPVLVAGEPVVYDPATAPNGAFPQELLEDRDTATDLPLAPDLRPAETLDSDRGEGFDTALLRILARLLGIDFPELTQRHLVAERENRRLRNRVIAALSILLVVSIAGGWTAWMQKQAADRRLAQAVGSAARQVRLASEFRDRYGIPSSVASELFGAAAQDFADIVADAGNNPALVLERARYNLGMADLAADTEGSVMKASDFLSLAKNDVLKSRHLVEAWYAPLLFRGRPSSAAILREEINTLDIAARMSARLGAQDLARDHAENAQAIAQQLAAGQGRLETPDTVFGKCALANVLYELSQVPEALDVYMTCLEGARALWQQANSLDHRNLLVRSLIGTGMILRLDRIRQPAALQMHLQAVELAREGTDESNDQRLITAEALVTFADTLNLSQASNEALGANLESQVEAYQEARQILSTLESSDANRRDWKILNAQMAYRLAGVRARLSSAQNEPDGLDEAEADLTSGIATVATLVQRFPDDLSLSRMHSAFLESRAEILVLRLPTVAPENVGAMKSMIEGDLHDLMQIRQSMAERYENNVFFQRDLANAFLTKARLRSRLGEPPAEIANDFSKAREIFEAIAQIPGVDAWSARDLALTDYKEAELFKRHGHLAQACTLAKNARSHMARLTDAYPEDKRVRNEANDTLLLVDATCG